MLRQNPLSNLTTAVQPTPSITWKPYPRVSAVLFLHKDTLPKTVMVNDLFRPHGCPYTLNQYSRTIFALSTYGENVQADNRCSHSCDYQLLFLVTAD
jgi:hypothetical protein